MDWRNRIAWDPKICHGQPCIKGTRILIYVILDNVAAGRPVEEILRSYPTLTHEDISAVLHYAADLANERAYPLEVA